MEGPVRQETSLAKVWIDRDPHGEAQLSRCSKDIEEQLGPWNDVFSYIPQNINAHLGKGKKAQII